MSAAESPDIRQLQGEVLPTADFPAGAVQDFRVYFAPTVHDQIWKHASENLELEICGVLVGHWQRDAKGPFVSISEFIRCDSAKSGFAEVTFTHESWTKINAEMDTRLSGFKIVGWYHSHPDFGIFLSDRDIFIHQHFFSGSGQIAHVVDPVRKIEGVFAWHAGKPVLRPHFWVGERIFVTPEMAGKDDVPKALQAEPVQRMFLAPETRSAWLGMLSSALMYLCVFVLGYLLAGRPSEWVRQLDRQRDLEGIVVHFARLGLLRPGLDENLGKVGSDLLRVSSELNKLANGHVKVAGDDKQTVKEEWEAVHDRLTEVEQHLGHMRKFYSLSPDDQALVKAVERELVQMVERELRGPRRPSSGEEEPAPSDEKSGGDTKSNTSRKKSTSSAPKPAGGSSKASEKRTPSKE